MMLKWHRGLMALSPLNQKGHVNIVTAFSVHCIIHISENGYLHLSYQSVPRNPYLRMCLVGTQNKCICQGLIII